MTERYSFRTSDEILIKYLEKYSNKNDAIKDILEKFANGDLVSKSDKELDIQLKQQRLKKLTAEANIKKWEWEHIETFAKTPTYQGEKAIKERASNEKSFRELTQQEIDVIVKHISLENTFDGIKVTCKHCRIKTTYNDRLEALHDATRHLSAVHGQKILQK